MNVDLYEKIWLWGAAGIILVFLISVGVTTIGAAIRPPSHVETIDPTTVLTDPRFAQPGVVIDAEGAATAVVVARMFSFLPDTLRVPRGRPVTFRLTSPDVLHGFQVVGTNANAMVMPGYVTQFTMRFDRAGTYLIVCNEFCGLAHHAMYGRLIVEEVAP